MLETLALAREDGVGRTVGHDPAACLDHDHAVDEREHLGDAVLDEHHRYVATLRDASQYVADRARAVRVEVRGRLIEEQNARSEHEDPGDRESLLLSTRERRGRAIFAVREADVRQRAVDSRPDLRRRDAVVLEAERHVVACAGHDELRFRILQHQAGRALDTELALLLAATAAIKQAGKRVEERALPRARRSY